MAGKRIKHSGKDTATVQEFVCDTEDEVSGLPTTTDYGTGAFEGIQEVAPIGSTCIVGNDGGDLLIYMLFSFGWKKI